MFMMTIITAMKVRKVQKILPSKLYQKDVLIISTAIRVTAGSC